MQNNIYEPYAKEFSGFTYDRLSQRINHLYELDGHYLVDEIMKNQNYNVKLVLVQ
jgi:hypothetical protein